MRKVFATAALVAAFFVASCGTITLGGEGGIESPAVTLTQEGRCAWYRSRIPALEAMESRSTLQEFALTTYRLGVTAECQGPTVAP